MENINFEDESVYLNSNEINDNLDPQPNQSKETQSFRLSNPIFTEMINFTVTSDDVDYDLQIIYKNEKWMIKRKLSEIKNLIKTLQNLNYVFISENYFKNLSLNSSSSSIKEINVKILSFLRYINYRFDLLSNVVTRDFFAFEKSSEPEEILKIVQKDNLEQIFNFKVDESDLTLSDFIYDSELGLLVIGLEDQSYFSRIGRFWSLIEYEVLGNCYIFQRVFDKESRPYFRKSINKTFDARVSKVELDRIHNKLYVGLDNGTIQIFNISVIDPNQYKKGNQNDFEYTQNKEKIIAINEGNNFRYLSDRITGLSTYQDFLFISSKENKLIIVDIIKSIPEVKFNGSLKKRISGKGHISNIKIDQTLKKLFIITYTNKLLIYDIILINKFDSNSDPTVDVKIELMNEIETASNIKDVFFKGLSIFIGLDNKIQIINVKQDKTDFNLNLKDASNIIPLDGSLSEDISYSSKYMNFNYSNYISSISYFTELKLIILGLVNGAIIAFNSRSLELLFAKKISEHGIKKLILLEENYIVIAGDVKGNIFFFKFGF